MKSSQERKLKLEAEGTEYQQLMIGRILIRFCSRPQGGKLSSTKNPILFGALTEIDKINISAHTESLKLVLEIWGF